MPAGGAANGEGETASWPVGRHAILVVPGPWATRLGQLYVVLALLANYGIVFGTHPTLTTYTLLVLLACFVVIVPSACLRRALLPGWSLALFGWLVCSAMWTQGAPQTSLLLRTVLPSLVGLVLVTGTLTRRAVLGALRSLVQLALLLCIVALLTRPATRSSADGTFFIAGWRGVFVDKNSMALFLVLCVAATVAFDRGRRRAATLTVVLVLMAGSQSVTGLAGAALILVFARWLALVRRQDKRRTSTFVGVSAALAGVVTVGVLVNATTLFQLFGKDPNLTGRTQIWTAVIGAITRRPELGYGWGALFNRSAPTQTTLQLWREIGFPPAHSHNGVLDLVGQVGVVGLVLFGFVVVTTLRQGVRVLRMAPDVATFALTFTAAQLLISISESVFLNPAWLTAVVLVQALLLRPVPTLARPTDGSVVEVSS